MPLVNREEARRIAADYLKAHLRENCDGIEKVTTIAELEEFMIRRPCVYGLPAEKLRQCWIAYAGRPAGCCTVTGGDIIVVAQRTGEVVFCGSASDER